VPLSILYDNTKIAVAKILGDGKRQRTRVFSELQSHYLFKDRFGRPGKGNDKGKVEGLVGYARRNFMVPVPHHESFEALNAWLEEQCLKRQGDRLRGVEGTIEDRLARDLDKLSPLPPVAYDACEIRSTQSTSLSLVRYRCVDYSVPTAYAHRDVLVRGYVHEVVISCGAEVIARHPRSYEREDIVFDPLHYLALLEQKVGAPARWGAQNLALAAYGRRGRRRHCRAGSFPIVLRLCAVFWKREWARPASGNMFRFCG
jgi:hypothetical protein